MSDQHDLMNAVIGDYTPLGEEHPAAQETYESVREMLQARGEELQQLDELETISTSYEVGVIKPGDTVIFSTRDHISGHDADELKKHITKVLPGITPVILSGLRVEAVYRSEDDDA